MNDNYHRLVEVVAGPCRRVLHSTMAWLVLKDTATATTSIAKHVSMKSSKVRSLHQRRKLTDIQLKDIQTYDDERWDVSILCILILNLFPKLSPGIRISVETIRTERNKLFHKVRDGCIDQIAYDLSWNNLENNLIRLANACRNTHLETEVRLELPRIKKSEINFSQDSTRRWYLQWFDMVNRTNSCANKRFKASNALDRLRDELATTFKKYHPMKNLPDAEVEMAKRMLVEHRSLVVVGHGNDRHLKVALSAIAKLVKSPRRRAQLILFSDWHAIDRKEINVVLCLNPFGDVHFDMETFQKYRSIFDSVDQTINDENAKLRFVIVSRKEVFDQIKLQQPGYSHNLLQTCLCIGTNADDPVDLTIDHRRCRPLQDPVSQHIIERTKACLNQEFKLDVDDEDVKHICNKLSSENIIILVCPDKITDVYLKSIATGSAYHIDSSFILRTSEEFSHLPLDIFSLVIIKDAFGLDSFDIDHFKQWRYRFEDFKVFAKEGKTHIILTTTENVLDQFKRTHPDFILPGEEVVLPGRPNLSRSSTGPFEIVSSSLEDDVNYASQEKGFVGNNNGFPGKPSTSKNVSSSENVSFTSQHRGRMDGENYVSHSRSQKGQSRYKSDSSPPVTVYDSDSSLGSKQVMTIDGSYESSDTASITTISDSHTQCNSPYQDTVCHDEDLSEQSFNQTGQFRPESDSDTSSSTSQESDVLF